MNIWILNHYAGPPASGRADRAAHIARELTKAGHTCTVFHAAFHHLLMEPREIATPISETHDGADFIAIPTRPYEGNGIARLRNMFEFPRRVLAESPDVIARSGIPDVVIVSSPPPMSIRAARRLRRRHGSKVVFEVRDPWPDSLIELAGAPRWHPFVALVRMLVRSAYRHADAVVVTTPGLSAHVSQNGGPEAVTHSITNGVDVAQFDEAMENPVPQPHDREFERLRQLGKTVVVYAGSMGPPNALEQLLAIDPPEDAPFHLVLVGEGVSKASLESAAHERDLGWVTFLPKVAKDQVPPLLSRADATIIAWHDSPIYRWGVSPNKI
ncbi:MAG: glycosyltransferase family 4 protein, partial [Acidimicrobiia bacterium]|nr:glycosyltransferase family 4 protein [Acidimicrobiia bacterium]